MFSQVKSSQDRSEGGLGIGLALSKGVVELHGGTIEARSAGPGMGSEFVVRIPRRTVSRARMAQPEATPAAPRRTRKRRVLIADDNRDAAESLAMLLRDGRSHRHGGARRPAGLSSDRELRARTIALLDIGMPEIDGYEVARRVRVDTRGRGMFLIAVTGWGQEQRQGARRGGRFRPAFHQTGRAAHADRAAGRRAADPLRSYNAAWH